MMTLRLLLSQIIIVACFILSACNSESPPEPSVSFTTDNSKARVGETITFTNSSQFATSYEWNFGDDNSSNEENPTHSYSRTGVFKVTLTANGEGGPGSTSKFITIYDLVLESTFFGDSITFQGPIEFNSQPVKLIFYNQSSVTAAANLVMHKDGYSHQDMLATFVNGISEAHHPNWTTEIEGTYKEISADRNYTWIGNLEPGIYTLVSASIDPLRVWYVAGLTIH